MAVIAPATVVSSLTASIRKAVPYEPLKGRGPHAYGDGVNGNKAWPPQVYDADDANDDGKPAMSPD
eukprot:2024917-Alexandrium_andersonii.AAC.1